MKAHQKAEVVSQRLRKFLGFGLLAVEESVLIEPDTFKEIKTMHHLQTSSPMGTTNGKLYIYAYISYHISSYILSYIYIQAQETLKKRIELQEQNKKQQKFQ